MIPVARRLVAEGRRHDPWVAGDGRPAPPYDPGDAHHRSRGRGARGADLPMLDAAIVDCFACPRLVAWRESVARVKVARFRDETYWARPVPGYGDPTARILIVGLAPAAHGGNRTGRVFTGDESGEFLWRALHAQGLSDRPVSRRAATASRSRHPGRGRRPVRPARQQADARGAATLSPVPRPRARAAHRVAGVLASARSAGTRRSEPRRARPPPPGPKPRFGHGAETRIGPLHAARQLSPEPAEHVHRPAHPADAPGGARRSPRAGGAPTA